MNHETLLRVLDLVDSGGLHQGFVGYKHHKTDSGVVVLRWILVMDPEARKKHKVTLRDARAAIREGYISKSGDSRFLITEKGYALFEKEQAA